MPNAFDIIEAEEKKIKREIRNRERMDQFKGVKKAERERVCKLIRDNSTLFWNPDLEPTRKLIEHLPKESWIIDDEVLNKIERGEL